MHLSMAEMTNFCAGKMNILLPELGAVVGIDEADGHILPLEEHQGAAFRGAAPGPGQGARVQDQPWSVGGEVGHVGVTVEDHVRVDFLAPIEEAAVRIILVAVEQQKPLPAQVHLPLERLPGPIVAVPPHGVEWAAEELRELLPVAGVVPQVEEAV